MYEQASPRQTHANPRNALRTFIHALNQPRCRRVDQHRDELLEQAGEACLAIHEETVRNVKASRIQCDEIWSFYHAKQKNVATAKAAPEGAGDVWTWTALDADTKLIVSFYVGDRSGESAMTLKTRGTGKLNIHRPANSGARIHRLG